jgi:hypothetical protein
MSCDYVEILTESRPINVTQTSTEQDIVIQFRLPTTELDDGTTTTTTPSPYSFLGDDADVLALETAYSILPMGRWMPTNGGDPVYLILDNIRLSEVDNYGWWKATAHYVFNVNTGQGGNRPEAPESMTLPFIRVGFAVGNRTKTITQSLQVRSRIQTMGPLGGRPLPDEAFEGNAIGVSEDNIIGAEVYTSGLTLQITGYYFPEKVTLPWIVALAELFPSLNASTFLGVFAPGEALLIGADGASTVGEIIPITYTVEIKRHVINRPDPPFPNITCEGHDIIDYRYIKNLLPNASILTQVPAYRVVHRGYEYKDFTMLGLPYDGNETTTTTTTAGP